MEKECLLETKLVQPNKKVRLYRALYLSIPQPREQNKNEKQNTNKYFSPDCSSTYGPLPPSLHLQPPIIWLLLQLHNHLQWTLGPLF